MELSPQYIDNEPLLCILFDSFENYFNPLWQINGFMPPIKLK